MSDSSSDFEDQDAQLRSVSFASLMKAQRAIEKDAGNSRKRKRGDATNEEQESKLAGVRERLRELRERSEGRPNFEDKQRSSGFSNSGGGDSQEKRTRHSHQKAVGDVNSESDSDSEDQDSDSASASDASSQVDGKKLRNRSSKHAPTAMPANRAVGRHREVIQVAKIKSRDPRFAATSGYIDQNVVKNRYSFIDEYQANELTQLKQSLKDPKAKLGQEQRDTIQRKIISLESKIAAAKAREREEKVRREHKKKEREAIASGKKPFYLKQSDVKKQALIDRFDGMKSRQKDKVIQRRRKKLAARERKGMPMDRRTD